MTFSLPTANFVTGSTGTNRQEWADYDNSMLFLLRHIVKVPETLTIAGGVITPSSSYVLVDTEGGASTDALDRIDTANILASGASEARVLLLRIVDAARHVTLTHQAGGAGQIVSYTGASIELRDPSTVVLLRYDPGAQAWAVLGVWYGLGDMPHRLRVREDAYGLEHVRAAGAAGVRVRRETAAVSDLGILDIAADDASGATVSYAQVLGALEDATTGAHSGRLDLVTWRGGAQKRELQIGGGVLVGETTAGGRKGEGTVNATAYYRSGTVLELPVVARLDLGMPPVGSYVEQPHNLGGEPDIVQAYLKCLTSEGGYPVGYMFDISHTQTGDQNLWGVAADATNIRVIRRGTPAMVKADGSGRFRPTDANWTINVRLVRFS